MPKVQLLSRLVEDGIIAVMRGVPLEKMEKVAEHLILGGVRSLEITVDSPIAFEAIQQVSSSFRGDALVGAGTVLDSETAKLAIQSGAEFIFSPILSEDVIRTTLRYGKIAAPGVMTPTEMLQAIERGADVVKIFPATGLGVAYIKDVKGPLKHIPVIPTGGIHLGNIGDFVRAGVAAVGIGGNLVDRQAIDEDNYSKITSLAVEFVTAFQAAR